MSVELLAGDQKLLEQEYYSVGGGFIEWKGYKATRQRQTEVPYAHASELKKYLYDDKNPLEKLFWRMKMAISGKSEKEIWEFLDQVAEVMVRLVDTGLKMESVLPGPSSCRVKRRP
jgi:L-serine dehydratase